MINNTILIVYDKTKQAIKIIINKCNKKSKNKKPHENVVKQTTKRRGKNGLNFVLLPLTRKQSWPQKLVK